MAVHQTMNGQFFKCSKLLLFLSFIPIQDTEEAKVSGSMSWETQMSFIIVVIFLKADLSNVPSYSFA